MAYDSGLTPHELYQQGLQHFNRGEWQAAITAFEKLQTESDFFPGVEGLLADARLKQKLEGADRPEALAPPRRSLLAPILAGVVVLLAALIGVAVYQLRPAPPEVAIIPTPVPATATPQPTATLEPTAAPTQTPPPTEVAILPGTVEITSTDASVFVTTPRNIAIIFDGSGSMRTKVAGTDKQRWQVAQDALRTFLTSGSISTQSNVALRTYGRRRTNDCNDFELVQALSRFNPDNLIGVVDTLQPIPGARTPLALSIRAATEDLLPAEGSTVIIVITDGDETCDGNPAAEAANFIKDAPDRKVHVIGFALDRPEDNARLQQIAVNGNGLYFDANNGAELAAALRQTVELSYHVLAEDGTQVANGVVGGGPIQVNPGRYTLRINATPPVDAELIVENGSKLQVEVRPDTNGLTADIRDAAQTE